MRCVWRVAGWCLLVSVWGVSACGGSSPTGPTAGPATSSFSGTVATFGTASHAVTVTQGGALSAVLTWTAAVDLDLYLTSADCTGYPPDACAILARSAASSGNREEVTLTVASGDRLLVWIDNFSVTTAVPYSVGVTIR